MYVCMHVCVCMYVRMHVCDVCLYVCMHVCVCMYACTCVCVCLFVCTYVRMYICMYVCMYVRVYVRMYVAIPDSILTYDCSSLVRLCQLPRTPLSPCIKIRLVITGGTPALVRFPASSTPWRSTMDRMRVWLLPWGPRLGPPPNLSPRSRT